MSLAATRLALDDAKYDPAAHDPYATSVVLAGGSGGNEFGQREIQALWSQGRARGQRLPVDRLVLRGQRRADLHPARHQGPGGGARLRGRRRAGQPGHGPPVIRRGTPAVLAGGTEAPLSPVRAGLPDSQRPLDPQPDPRDGYQPFDAARQRLRARRGRRGARGRGRRGRARSAVRSRSTARSPGTPPPTTPTTTSSPRRTARSSPGRCARRSPTPQVTPGRGRPRVRRRRRRARPGRAGGRRRSATVFGAARCRSPRRRASSAGCAPAAARSTWRPRCWRMRDGVAPAVGNLDPARARYGLDLVREPRAGWPRTWCWSTPAVTAGSTVASCSSAIERDSG